MRNRFAVLGDFGNMPLSPREMTPRSLVAGLFYGVDGMRVGGMRRVEIAPHLAYGDRGVPGVIPPDAVLIAEVTILERV